MLDVNEQKQTNMKTRGSLNVAAFIQMVDTQTKVVLVFRCMQHPLEICTPRSLI